ncbi:MAG TPA: SPFH domain-containing protein [Acidimicrobiales bacterium]|nr:SPFH domain-containing protein [Acidimicrobiales bacterium]
MPLFKREFIAVPDDRKNQIVFKWPDNSIRRFTRAIVDADELALFLNQGQVVGTLEPGQHQIDADELPFLGAFIDRLSGGNAYRAELFFVGTREYTGMRFGGRIDDVKDPQTGLIVTLRVFGDYSLKVTDPGKLITTLTGTVDVSDNGAVAAWISDQLLKVMRGQVTTQIVRNGWPVLGLSAYTADIEGQALEATAPVFQTYGLAIVRLGNFDVNLAEDDEESLKRLAKDSAYSQMVGGFQKYAAGEALLGAGEGMAKGGGAAGGAILATGLGVGQQAAAGIGAAQAGPEQTGPAPGAAPAGAEAAAGEPRFCSSCGAALAPGSRFCSSCGKAVAGAQADGT